MLPVSFTPLGRKAMHAFIHQHMAAQVGYAEYLESLGEDERESALGFMSGEHRAVHHCVVRELPRLGEPLPPDHVADRLDMPVDRVRDIFQELEDNMTFLFRNPAGEVIWAYPVTVEKTPHHVTFDSGETLYAA